MTTRMFCQGGSEPAQGWSWRAALLPYRADSSVRVFTLNTMRLYAFRGQPPATEQRRPSAPPIGAQTMGGKQRATQRIPINNLYYGGRGRGFGVSKGGGGASKRKHLVRLDRAFDWTDAGERRLLRSWTRKLDRAPLSAQLLFLHSQVTCLCREV